MKNIMRLDLHALIPRFATLRLSDPQRLRNLARSIERNGQLAPVIAVADEKEDLHWVLIDGYRRREALQQVGEDLIWVDVWDHPVDEALLLCLARGPERAWEAIEEAALLQELASRYSLREIAQRIGRDVSWVSRRLSLFKALPEDLLEGVRQGKLSVWAATRVLAPLARANPGHARTLLAGLEQHPLSTRELKRLYEQYQQSNRTQRARLVDNPGLFLQALQSRQEATDDSRLAEGPEGAWCKDLAVIGQILKRLLRQVPTLFTPQQEALDRQRLQQAFTRIKDPFQRLDQRIEEASAHDPR
jgi:ParB family chromosome partitioning protein